MPIPAILDGKIGPEVTLHIFDYTSFSKDIAGLHPFTLNLKSGIARCPSGQVYFNIFWLCHPNNPDESFSSYELILDPQNPDMIQPFKRLSRQTHWHIFIVGPGDQVLNFFEVQNDYNLDVVLDVLPECVEPTAADSDYRKAKLEFQEMFSLQELIYADDSELQSLAAKFKEEH